MSTITTIARRATLFLSGVALGLTVLTGTASASPAHATRAASAHHRTHAVRGSSASRRTTGVGAAHVQIFIGEAWSTTRTAPAA